jgi:putative Mg2+ transporter-C (MgtC) family protein
MSSLRSYFDWSALIDLVVVLSTAFVFATLIGAERQYRQRSAGLRTNVLVAIGSAAFAAIGIRIGGQAGATQIVGYIVSGIGFLWPDPIKRSSCYVSLILR